MRQSVADLCTAADVLVDDLYQELVRPHDRRPGPRAACSDSAVITVTLVAEFVGLDKETRFLAYVGRNHRALFPDLPERSRYNRRRRHVTAVTKRMRQGVQAGVPRRLTPEERDVGIIDSLPVPVVGCAPARGSHRWYGLATDGHNATKQQTIDGFKLHLLITARGLILDVALVPANVSAGTLSEQWLIDLARLTVRGDKADLNAPVQHLLAGRNDLTLLTSTKVNQRDQQAPACNRLITPFRQTIATLNAPLAGPFSIERTQAKSRSGWCARIQAKLTAQTLGIDRNCLLTRPLWALASFALL